MKYREEKISQIFVEIEKNVPLPPARQRHYNYDWMRELEIGDSFKVETRDHAVKCSNWYRRNQLGTLTTRMLKDPSAKSGVIFRLWRIK
jgi:hypothetical protein